jgi:hypothetical protein
MGVGGDAMPISMPGTSISVKYLCMEARFMMSTVVPRIQNKRME